MNTEKGEVDMKETDGAGGKRMGGKLGGWGERKKEHILNLSLILLPCNR